MSSSAWNQAVKCGGALLALAFVLAVVGCGSDNPFDQVQVSGKVTFDDGTPIPGEVHVTFVPQTDPLDPKTYPKNGYTRADAQGNFSAFTSYRDGDGVVQGKHKVLIVTRDPIGRATDTIPQEYWGAQTTPLEVDTADSPFDLKVRKPR